MIGNRKSLNRQTLLDDPDPIRPRRRRVGIVVRNHSTDDNATVRVHTIKSGVLNRSAGVFKVQINAIGRGSSQFLDDVGGLVVDGGIEIEFVF